MHQTAENAVRNAAYLECAQPRRYSTRELFVGDKRVHIEHDGESYQLLITRNNKLILTK